MSEPQLQADAHAMEGPSSSRRRWVMLGVILVTTVTFVRMLLNFRHALPPATDGAYYPMQTWWLIEHGRLMYDDLPLIFWLNAALSHVIGVISAMPLAESVVLASRLIDSSAEPLVAIFILMLGYVWSSGRRDALLGCGAAAVFAVFSPPVLRMASDFQKNSLGLVWMVGALWAMRWALSRPHRTGRWVLLGVLVLLAGLTHIGAFGVTCIMLLTAVVVYFLSGGRATITCRGVICLIIVAGLGCVLLMVVWLFEPTRTTSLLTAPWRLVSLNHFRPSPAILLSVVVYVLLGLFMRWLWRNWQMFDRCDLAAAMGAVAASAVLVFPFFPQDYMQRFMLMTPVPAAVLIAFVMAHKARSTVGLFQRPAKILAAVVLLLALVSPLMMQGPTISTDEADQIKSFGDLVPDPSHTLIVAPHGLQYWAGLLLHTPVRMGELPDGAFTRYKRVLILQQTGSSHRQPPPRRDDRRPGPPAPPAMHTVKVPEDAIELGSTAHFKLYEVKPPASSPMISPAASLAEQ